MKLQIDNVLSFVNLYTMMCYFVKGHTNIADMSLIVLSVSRGSFSMKMW